MWRCTTRASGKIDVQGWVTLTNSSGTTYENAQTLLVAGTPSRVGAEPAPPAVWHGAAAALDLAASRHRKRQPRAPGRLLSVSAR